jgi:protein O-GlcNAc transferase
VTPAERFAQALAHHRSGRLDEAEAGYRSVLGELPGHADSLRLLGLLSFARGRPAEALAFLGEAVDRHPGFVEARRALAAVLGRLGRRDEALAHHAEAARLAPQDAQVQNDLGAALLEADRPAEAASVLRAALLLDPGDADLLGNLAVALDRMGATAPALAAARHAVALRPGHAGSMTNLSIILASAGAYGPAERAAWRAVRLGPLDPGTWGRLGNALIDAGEPHAAAVAHAQALACDPGNRAAAGNRLYALTLSPDVSDEELTDAIRAWGSSMPSTGSTPRAEGEPGKRLRVGYVSADFGRHPVGWFLAGVLENHDPARVEAWCYSDRLREDDLTERLRGHASAWRRTAALDDGGLARLVREDGIDLLVDLSGHTAGSRLGAFALRPAPVQASWGGLIGTTGLPAMDWLIADPQEVPPELEPLYTERVLRLPHGYVCYRPPDYAPPVAPLPSAGRGSVTFGCFNRLAKLNDRVMALWARVLDAVPGSRLLLRTKELTCPELRSRIAARFAASGIGPGRLELQPGAAHRDLLASYSEVDVALDTFPYTGGLTTLEALWMGVPVVTLPGRRFVARHSLTHLTVLGHPEWAARDEDGYVRIAAGLAADTAALADLRRRLRSEMAASPLTDGATFTRNLEAAYRAMWRAAIDPPPGRSIPLET